MRKRTLEKSLLWLVLLLLIVNLFKKSVLGIEASEVTIVRDTIWKTKTDTFKIETTKYEKVYVHKKNVTQIIRDTVFINDKIKYTTARLYRDTLSTKDVEIYSNHLIKGELLSGSLAYKLKIPKEILVTKTIKAPKKFRSGLYLFSEIGGKNKKANNLSLGLQYNQKGSWFISYRCNISTLSQPTHNLGFGLRLFK